LAAVLICSLALSNAASLAAQESSTAFSASQRSASRCLAASCACGSLVNVQASALGVHRVKVAAEADGATEIKNAPIRTATMLAHARSKYQEMSVMFHLCAG